MITRKFLFAAAAFAAALAMQSSAQALTLTERSAKYKDAKAAGTLNGASWNDFRKNQCDVSGSGGTAKRSAASAAGTTAVAGNAVFPAAVDSKYSNEKPGRARRRTCLDQYKANKASNANGGLRWLHRLAGGGKCNSMHRQFGDLAVLGAALRIVLTDIAHQRRVRD